MDSRLILIALFLGVAAAYPLRALLLREQDDHEGPFPSDISKRYVRFESSGHTQQVALFDWIRRLFGVYEVNKLGEWVVYEKKARVELWTCPFCLSWHVSWIFSIGLVISAFGLSLSALLLWFPVHCFIAIVSQCTYRYLFSD